jgi:two-component system OmpR family sensor kinase
MTIILLSGDGAPILQTNSTNVADVTQHQMQQIIFSSTNRLEPKHFAINDMLFATVPVEIAGFGDGTLAVGYSTKVMNATLKNIIITIAVILLIMVIITCGLWQKIIKHYLLPLEKISDQSLQIKSSNDLKQKIEIQNSTTELENITNSYNNLLEKLKNVFEQEHSFFSDTAHSLKTPLAVIRSYIESLPKQSQKQKFEILKNIDHLNITIQDLLLISQLHGNYQTKYKRISLSKTVRQIAELTCTLAIQKNIVVKSNIEKNINIAGDEALLKKAIANVAKNAVDHEKTNGTITINLKKSNDYILLTVSDTGCGINIKDQKKIFNRFFQATNSKSKKGNGLGLAITKAIIENFGGKISISSKINKGTIVFILFS